MPLTTCCWNYDSSLIFVGAIDGAIRGLDINSGQFYDVGMHKNGAPLNYLSFLADKNVLLTTAYDTDVNFWQLGTQAPVHSISAPKKIFKSHCSNNMFCAGMLDERILIANLNQFNSKSEVDSMDLGKGSQIQSICVRCDGKSLGIGSIDGRANISAIEPLPNKVNHSLVSVKIF